MLERVHRHAGGVRQRTADERRHNAPGEKQLVRDDRHNIPHIIQILSDILPIPALPRPILRVRRRGLAVTSPKGLQLLDEAVVRVDLWAGYIWPVWRHRSDDEVGTEAGGIREHALKELEHIPALSFWIAVVGDIRCVFITAHIVLLKNNMQIPQKKRTRTESRYHSGATRNPHHTVHQNASSVTERMLDERTGFREVYQEVVVFRVLDRDVQVLGACRWEFWADGYNMRNRVPLLLLNRKRGR
jgi:hypothetical protein